MPSLTSYFQIAANQPGPVYKIKYNCLWPEWKTRDIDKVDNRGNLAKAGFTAAILGISSGSPDPRSITTGEKLDASIFRLIEGGARNIIICNNFAPYQFETARIEGISDDEAYAIVAARGKDWHSSNVRLLAHYNEQAQARGIGFKVVNWDELRSSPRFHRMLPHLHRRYSANNPQGTDNFANVIHAYIRSYMSRYIAKRADEADAMTLLKKPTDLGKVKRLAEIHIEKEKEFLEEKRKEPELYFGKFYTPSNDFLLHLTPDAFNGLVNSAVEKVAGYALMSDMLAEKMRPEEKIAYVHHGGIVYWEEYFRTHPEVVEELKLGQGLNRIAYFVASEDRRKAARISAANAGNILNSAIKSVNPELLPIAS